MVGKKYTHTLNMTNKCNLNLIFYSLFIDFIVLNKKTNKLINDISK